MLGLREFLAVVFLDEGGLGGCTLEKGIPVFLLQGLDSHLLTVYHSTDAIVATLHLEHGKVVYLLTVSSLQLIELLQGNGLGDLLLLGGFHLLLFSLTNTLLGCLFQIVADSHTVTVTDELGQVFVQRGVLEVDIGNALVSFLGILRGKAFLDDMLLLQACRCRDFLASSA